MIALLFQSQLTHLLLLMLLLLLLFLLFLLHLELSDSFLRFDPGFGGEVLSAGDRGRRRKTGRG